MHPVTIVTDKGSVIVTFVMSQRSPIIRVIIRIPFITSLTDGHIVEF